MLIAFLGDFHGHVFEGLAIISRLQRALSRRFDLVVQLGDFGIIYPDNNPDKFEEDSHEALDPGQFDLTNLLNAEGSLAGVLNDLRRELSRPILFIYGDHDDEDQLRDWRDPFGLFEFVPSASHLQVQETTIAFLGTPGHGRDAGSHEEGVSQLLSRPAGSIDILATHAGPAGVWRGYYGEFHGSRLVTEVIEHLQPRFCIGAHFHHSLGPIQFGRTTYFGLDGVTSGRWHPYSGVSPGCVAVLDIDLNRLSRVPAEWLGVLAGPCAPSVAMGGFGVKFDLAAWHRQETELDE